LLSGLDRHDTAVVWDLRLHGELGGPSSTPDTARFVLAICYIDTTPFLGHTCPHMFIHNGVPGSPQTPDGWDGVAPQRHLGIVL